MVALGGRSIGRVEHWEHWESGALGGALGGWSIRGSIGRVEHYRGNIGRGGTLGGALGVVAWEGGALEEHWEGGI